MDQEVVDAMSAAAVDANTAGIWCGALCATYETSSAAWDGFAEELRLHAGAAGLGSDVADDFIAHLTDQSGDPLDIVRRMCEFGPDWLTERYAERFAQNEDTGDDYDVAVWLAFLAENGAAWNGDEANWTAFVEWFHHKAGQAGLGAPAHEFVDYVATQPDKVAAFAEYGITVGAAAQEQAEDAGSYPALSEGDSGEWVAYLDQMLTAHGF